MDFFRAQFARIAKQLSGLTASQKMLALALVALTGMMLVWWARYAGEPVYEPLLDQSFNQTDLSQISTRLEAKGIAYQVTGDRILVPADRKFEILADLGFAHLLPQNTNAGFDEIVKQMTPWDPADKTARLWIEAKQRTLAAVIGSFPNIQEAVVVIDPHDERTFDGHDVTPSAMVNLVRLDHEAGGVRQLATAAADIVAGAEAGLSRGRVTVVVDGVTIPIPDKDDSPGGDGDEIIDQIRAAEAMYRDKILQQLGFIKGLMVSVRVDLDITRTETQKTTVDPKNFSHLVSSDKETSTETYPPPAGGGEAGVGSNLAANGALSVTPGITGQPNTDTQSETMYQNMPSTTVEHTIKGPGDAPPQSASVRVPRSYFIEMYKDINKGADPDDAALGALMTKELANIRDDVKKCTGIETDDAVAVNWYADGPGAAAALETAPSTGTAAASLRMLSSYGKQMGVGVLAAVSLFMVTMMVRKATPQVIPAVAAGKAGADQGGTRFSADSEVAGEVGEGGKMLDGMELDDEMVKGQQVVEQVATMVKEDPEGAASLVKRWLARS